MWVGDDLKKLIQDNFEVPNNLWSELGVSLARGSKCPEVMESMWTLRSDHIDWTLLRCPLDNLVYITIYAY